MIHISLVIDTALPSEIKKKSFEIKVTIDNQIADEKLQYDIIVKLQKYQPGHQVKL